MRIVILLMVIIGILDAAFAGVICRVIRDHREAVRKEPGNAVFLAFFTALMFFLGTFGISDGALANIVYPRMGLVETKKIPGTMIAESVLPVFVMTLGYLSLVQVDLWTLLLPVAGQVVGSLVGERISRHLPERGIKWCVSVGLFVAGTMMLLSRFSLLPGAGIRTELTGLRLALAVMAAFLGGIGNNVGVGSFTIILSSFYLLGLNQLTTYLVMMCASALAAPVSGIQYVRNLGCSLKITSIANVFGMLGAAAAILIVKQMNLAVLQWIVIGVILYTALGNVRQLLVESASSLS